MQWWKMILPFVEMTWHWWHPQTLGYWIQPAHLTLLGTNHILLTYMATPGHRVSGFGNVSGLGRGTIKLESIVNGKSHFITLKDVFHAPDAPFNLISISRALETGIEVLFASKSVKF